MVCILCFLNFHISWEIGCIDTKKLIEYVGFEHR